MRNKRWLEVFSMAVVFACLFYVYRIYGPSHEVIIDESKFYAVSRVVDGDTFKVKVGRSEVTVRLLGIDTPETVDPRKGVQCFGPEASAETKSLLGGRDVRLRANPNREVKDKYGRYLFYVYRDDGLFVNESLLLGGFAREYTYGKAYNMRAEFRADEKVAREAKKGLWGQCEVENKEIKK